MGNPRSRMITVVMAGALLVGAPVLAGCGQIAEKAIEGAAGQAVGGNVDINEDGVTVQDDQGNNVTIGDDVPIPDNWPAEIPVLEGGKLVSVMVAGDGASVNAMWTTPASAEETMAAYGAALESAGFTADSTSNTSGMVNSEYTGNGYTVSMTAVTADGSTTVIMTATKA